MKIAEITTIALNLGLTFGEDSFGMPTLFNGNLPQFTIVDNDDDTVGVYATYFNEDGDNAPDDTEVELTNSITLDKLEELLRAELATGMKPRQDEDEA